MCLSNFRRAKQKETARSQKETCWHRYPLPRSQLSAQRCQHNTISANHNTRAYFLFVTMFSGSVVCRILSIPAEEKKPTCLHKQRKLYPSSLSGDVRGSRVDTDFTLKFCFLRHSLYYPATDRHGERITLCRLDTADRVLSESAESGCIVCLHIFYTNWFLECICHTNRLLKCNVFYVSCTTTKSDVRTIKCSCAAQLL